MKYRGKGIRPRGAYDWASRNPSAFVRAVEVKHSKGKCRRLNVYQSSGDRLFHLEKDDVDIAEIAFTLAQCSRDPYILPYSKSTSPIFFLSTIEQPLHADIMKSTILAVLASIALVSTAPAPLIARTPPNIPSSSAAQTQLTGLRVAAQGPQTGYSRDLFPHWSTTSGSCNTRETVLQRDGTGVVTDSACASTSGRWFSPYDGATWSAASDVDIDHVVPLSNAWKVCRLAAITQYHS